MGSGFVKKTVYKDKRKKQRSSDGVGTGSGLFGGMIAPEPRLPRQLLSSHFPDKLQELEACVNWKLAFDFPYFVVCYSLFAFTFL